MAEVEVIHGDMLVELPKLAVRVSAVVCDPPYHFGSIVKRFSKTGGADRMHSRAEAFSRHAKGFMNKTWDAGDIAFQPETWATVADVMLPGAHLVAFAGTKGCHRMACAIEDAGFEIRDTLMFLYGSGFPKSHAVKDAKGNRTGWGTALKPAYEPIVLARKPLIGTVAQNVLAHGTGALNIDGCRVEWLGPEDAAAAAAVGFADSRARGSTKQSNSIGKESRDGTNRYDPNAITGRWPANVCHDGSDEVVKAFPEQTSGGTPPRRPEHKNSYSGGFVGQESPSGIGSTNGNAARFFYSAKADAADRLQSKHPTVKPVDLMRWLVRLVTPPGGLVLDPFAGSGTTGMACMAEGFDCILVERELEYVQDIRRRVAHVSGQDAPLFARAAE